MARVIAAPLLAVIMVGLIDAFEVFTLPKSLEWLWTLIWCVPSAWLAVSVHRFLLRDLFDDPTETESDNGKRVILYALLVLAIWALVTVAIFYASQFDVMDMPADGPEQFEQSLTHLQQIIAVLILSAMISALIGGRVCLVLPAIAVGGNVRDALRAARGNTLRLTVIFALLPTALTLLIGQLYRDDAGFVTLTLLLVLGAIFMVFEVAALSLSYRELIQPEPPPTDPPA